MANRSNLTLWELLEQRSAEAAKQRAEQEASGLPVATCCYCRSFTTIEDKRERQHVDCQACGAQMIISPQPRSRDAWTVTPLVDNPPAHHARKRRAREAGNGR